MQNNSLNSPSMLGNATPEIVAQAPFSHLVIEQPVADDIYRQLEADFPPPERFTKGIETLPSNQAIRIRALDIIDNPEFSDTWQSFFRYHTSQEFWGDILRVMGEDIRRAHPTLEQRVGKKFEDWTVKVRGASGEADIELDALFVINTPVHQEGSVRPAHVDSENEIFAGLFYMKPEEDTTPGGNLALYSFKDRTKGFGGHYADLNDVNEDQVVDYGRNRFLAFVNSPVSIHGVTPRPVTQHYRRYINFIAVTSYATFTLPKLPIHKQLKFWLSRRKNKAKGVTLEM